MGDPTASVRSPDGNVELAYDYRPELLPGPAPARAGLWRYIDLLPLGDGDIRYPLPVGDTPLVASPGLRAAVGHPHLWVKDESRGPTGSNKDRATALVIEGALREGRAVITCASTGNVAISTAVGAAAAGMRAVVFVPADVSDAKLQLMLLAGATVVKVRAGYRRAIELSRSAAQTQGWVDRNTGVNPWTVEAKKTVAYEIWEQLDREVPDVVVVPVGDGPTLCALSKGFRELVACRAADRLPELVAVQAAGCAPLCHAWQTGTAPLEPTAPHTIADGIAVADPLCAETVLRDVRDHGGAFVAVSDGEMLDAMRLLAGAAGLLAEPAGACATAGLLKAVDSGVVRPDQRTVVMLTGTALKTPHLAPGNGATLEVGGELDEVLVALSSTRGTTTLASVRDTVVEVG